jgi:hypothetical protein
LDYRRSNHRICNFVLSQQCRTETACHLPEYSNRSALHWNFINAAILGVFMHAHRCKNCAKQGINTIWIHGDCQQGNPGAHTCPKCGEKEWEKWLVPVGQLPKNTPHNVPQSLTVVPLDHVILMLFYCMILGIILNATLFLVKQYLVKKEVKK